MIYDHQIDNKKVPGFWSLLQQVVQLRFHWYTDMTSSQMILELWSKKKREGEKKIKKRDNNQPFHCLNKRIQLWTTEKFSW